MDENWETFIEKDGWEGGVGTEWRAVAALESGLYMNGRAGRSRVYDPSFLQYQQQRSGPPLRSSAPLPFPSPLVIGACDPRPDRAPTTLYLLSPLFSASFDFFRPRSRGVLRQLCDLEVSEVLASGGVLFFCGSVCQGTDSGMVCAVSCWLGYCRPCAGVGDLAVFCLWCCCFCFCCRRRRRLVLVEIYLPFSFFSFFFIWKY